MDMEKILIGNTFPLGLIRRKVQIEPCSLEDLLAAADGKMIVSFWGHANTLEAVNRATGLNLTPGAERPALALSADRLPRLGKLVFRQCYIVSPNYRQEAFRPKPGDTVPLAAICDWQILKICWE